jgi:Fur family ferric uptake transcriptional regulator
MTSLEHIRDRLHECGLRCTEPRRCIIEALERGPRTHAQLLEETGLDRVTVYRNLQALQKAGLVYRVPIEGSETIYVLCREGSSLHAHFFCERCHRAYCLEPGTFWLTGPWGKSVHRVLLLGICPQCR